MMPDEVRGRLEEILAALPVLDDRRQTVAKEAEYLWVHAGLMAANDQPRANPTGTKQAERELLELRKRIKPLVLHIDKMHRTALDAMEAKGVRSGVVLANDLVRAAIAAWRGVKRLRSQPGVKLTGRPGKKRAEAIATATAAIYERLTGRKATIVGKSGKALGPYLDFLKAVFDACGIDASPEAQARVALKEKRHSKKGR